MSNQSAINNAMKWMAFHMEVCERMQQYVDSPRTSRDQKQAAQEIARTSNRAWNEQRSLLINRYNVPISSVRRVLGSWRNQESDAAYEAGDRKVAEEVADRRQGGSSGNAGLNGAIRAVLNVVNASMVGKDHEKKILDVNWYLNMPYSTFLRVNAKLSARLRIANPRIMSSYMNMGPAIATTVKLRLAAVGAFGFGFGFNETMPGFQFLPPKYISEIKKAFNIEAKVETQTGFFADVPMGIGVFDNGDVNNPKVVFRLEASGTFAMNKCQLKLEFPSWTSAIVGFMYEALKDNGMSGWGRQNSVLMYPIGSSFKVFEATTPVMLLTFPNLARFRSSPGNFGFVVGSGSFQITPHPDLSAYCVAVRNSASNGIQRFGQWAQRQSQEIIDNMPAVRFVRWAHDELFN